MAHHRSLTLLLLLSLSGVTLGCGSLEETVSDANNGAADSSSVIADATIADATSPDAAIANCTPGEITCTAGTLTLCDSEGKVADQSTCALGCFDDSRCARLQPSNNLLNHLMNASRNEVAVLEDSAVIDTDSGAIIDSKGKHELAVMAMKTESVDVLVIIVKSLKAKDIRVQGSRALAIVADGEILITESLDVSAQNIRNGPGAHIEDTGCAGKNGNGILSSWSGGGGAGFGGRGGNGGTVKTQSGGKGGALSGNEQLSPLRGGCPGGWAGGAEVPPKNETDGAPGGGGGAVQLVSNQRIVIAGQITANGGGAKGNSSPKVPTCVPTSRCMPGNGAGSGGGILLEAPQVIIGQGGGLFANGGGGSCEKQGHGTDGAASTEPALGGSCKDSQSTGGMGGALKVSDGTAGITGEAQNAPGGGGGVGRIRISLPKGVKLQNNGQISPAPSIGIVETR